MKNSSLLLGALSLVLSISTVASAQSVKQVELKKIDLNKEADHLGIIDIKLKIKDNTTFAKDFAKQDLSILCHDPRVQNANEDQAIALRTDADGKVAVLVDVLATAGDLKNTSNCTLKIKHKGQQIAWTTVVYKAGQVSSHKFLLNKVDGKWELESLQEFSDILSNIAAIPSIIYVVLTKGFNIP